MGALLARTPQLQQHSLALADRQALQPADRAQVALACHVPKELQTEKELTCKEWFNTVCEAMRGEVEISEESDEMIVAVCKGSKEKELFPLKMRDAGSSAGYQMLLKRGLIPQDGALLQLHSGAVT